MQLTGLTAETTYYLTVSSKDINDNGPTLSDVVTFKTLVLPDTTAPVIIGSPLIQNITHKSVVIRWETDEPASSVVTMSTEPTSLDRIESHASLKTHHNLAITGLIPETVYYFKVISTDAAGNNVISELMSFQSKALGHQGVPHIISGPFIERTTDTSISVSWQTDVNADSRLVCIGGSSTLEVNRGKRSKQHQLTITGLTKNTAYSCVVHSTDIHGYAVNSTVTSTSTADSQTSAALNTKLLKASAVSSTITTAATPDTTAPAFTLGPLVFGYGDLALVSWSVDELASVKIQYKKTTDTDWLYDGTLTQNKVQSLVLTRLIPSTAYQLQITVTDSSGNQAQSAVIDFNSSTRASLAAPSFVVQPSFSSIVDNSGIISWTTEGFSFGQVHIGKASDALTDRESRISAGTSHTVSLVGLNAGTLYYVQVVAYNIAGNKVLSEIKSFMTTGTASADTDGDGLPNGWETDFGLNPNDPSDAALDTDNDGLTNIEEFQNNTDPTSADSDSDEMSDGFEVDYGLDPLDNTDASNDTDQDGLTNLQEFKLGTNPMSVDTDNDGMTDSYELDNDFDPLDGSDCPSWMCGSSKIWMYKLKP